MRILVIIDIDIDNMLLLPAYYYFFSPAHEHGNNHGAIMAPSVPGTHTDTL
jgi:hypothetical protein